MQNPNTTRGGQIKSWFLRKAKRSAVPIAIAVVSYLGVRTAVAEVFYAPTNAVAPEIPQKARVLVYKLGRPFKPQDIIVYRDPAGTAMLGRVVSVDAEQVTVTRANQRDQPVPLPQVVGRVVLNTR